MPHAFTIERDGEIATLLFDTPGEPVNKLSLDAGEELERLLSALEEDSSVSGIVLASGKKDSFVAGADIHIFEQLKSADDGQVLARRLQGLCDHVERCRKPIVAAIHGPCVGGGLEWVLACDYRIASAEPGTRLGLPETQLGILPGGGGTQRLPRLVGIVPALDMILTGRLLRAKHALQIGLVDEVVPAPILRAVAHRRAIELADKGLEHWRAGGARKRQGRAVLGALRRAAIERNPIGRALVFARARKKTLQKARGHYPALERAIEAMAFGYENGLRRGLEHEAELFGELVVSDVSRRLVEIFFARRALKKYSGTSSPSVKSRPVARVGVLGGGLMGSGVACATIQAGIPVRVREKDDAGVARTFASVRGILDERVKRRSIDRLERGYHLRLLTAGTGWEGFERLDLVVEAVFEDLALKQEMVRRFESVNASGIFASNTSSIPIARIAEASKRPESLLGMHYFSPVEKMPLLEVIVTERTAPEVTATAVALGIRQGKTIIVVKDGPGFYTTRILMPYMNEAMRLLSEGAAIEEIDGALLDFGFPLGPVALLDEIGIDVGVKVAKVLHGALGERMAPSHALDGLVAAGRLGRKTRKGFYTYRDSRKSVDVTVYDAIPGGRERTRMERREMAERVVCQMVNEAIRCLGEGILRDARDGDMGAVFGLGFPPFLGGPFRYADGLEPRKLLDLMKRLRDAHGERFEPAPLLAEQGRAGRRFYP
jgi:3-hydroxyacyl-CoA dehydrogenase/enoyl-CoA hydratase/3-hydroxybutyryl-CoA epimerase